MRAVERYQLIRDGGRVKSAGIPLDFVFNQGELFQAQPGPSSAAEVTRTFLTLRDNPPATLRNRFFPLDRGQVKALTKRSPALFRPILKTDQGAGKFLPFTVSEKGILAPSFRVALEQGYVIVESHFEKQLGLVGYPRDVMNEIEAMRGSFNNKDLFETFLAYERVQLASEKRGLVFNREVGVGRNAFMFIHPAKAETPIVLPENIVEEAEIKVNSAMGELMQRAEDKKKKFARQHDLPIRETAEIELPHYFQADVHILPRGKLIVAELQVPDVGLFLADLPSYGNEALVGIQEIVLSLKEKVVDGFEQTIRKVIKEKGEVPIYVVTRPEVIEQDEDVLENRELQEIQSALLERGYTSEIISAAAAAQLDSNSLLFLFNLDPTSENFKALLKAYLSDSKRKLTMVPDPFLRMVEDEVTEYKRAELSKTQIENFAALVKEVEIFDRSERVYTQLMAVDYFFRQLGIDEDVFHFCHPVFPTPVPAYRYDVRGLHIVSKMLSDEGIKTVEIRSIPISPKKGVLKDADGGTLYATFRFMFRRV